MFGSALSQGALAQPVALQLTVAHNDKLQKEYGPYKLAIANVFGEHFKKRHEPYSERRRVCAWEGRWVECSYFKMSNSSSITDAQKKTIEEILHAPCKHIAAPLPNLSVGMSDAQITRADRLKLYAIEKSKRLAELCKSGIFNSIETRIAIPITTQGTALEPDISKGEIGFEARIFQPPALTFKGVSK
jgi:hypothetical protein